jgi:hypothetical protein
MSAGEGQRFVVEIEGIVLDEGQMEEVGNAVTAAALAALSGLGLADGVEQRPLDPQAWPPGTGTGGWQLVKS